MNDYAELRAALDAGVTGASDPTANWLCVGGHTVMLNSGRPVWARIATCEHAPNAAYIAACHPEAIRALLAERDALREALKQYASPENWEQDEHGWSRLWLEPDSTSRRSYDGRELAHAALAQEQGD